jgi:hypothetical protein
MTIGRDRALGLPSLDPKPDGVADATWAGGSVDPRALITALMATGATPMEALATAARESGGVLATDIQDVIRGMVEARVNAYPGLVRHEGAHDVLIECVQAGVPIVAEDFLPHLVAEVKALAGVADPIKKGRGGASQMGVKLNLIAIYSPEAAALTLEALEGVTVKGHLTLGPWVRTFPAAFKVKGDLLLTADSGTRHPSNCAGAPNLEALPDGLTAKSIRLGVCPKLTHVGKITTEQLILEGAPLTELGLAGGMTGLSATACPALTTLPANLKANYVDLTGCTALRAIPPGWQIGTHLKLNGCTALEGMGAGVVTNALEAVGCGSLRTLPDDLVATGDVNLGNCAKLEQIPRFACRDLNLYGCAGLRAIPEGTKAGTIYLPGTQALRALPESLEAWTLVVDDAPAWGGRVPEGALVQRVTSAGGSFTKDAWNQIHSAAPDAATVVSSLLGLDDRHFGGRQPWDQGLGKALEALGVEQLLEEAHRLLRPKTQGLTHTLPTFLAAVLIASGEVDVCRRFAKEWRLDAEAMKPADGISTKVYWLAVGMLCDPKDALEAVRKDRF